MFGCAGGPTSSYVTENPYVTERETFGPFVGSGIYTGEWQLGHPMGQGTHISRGGFLREGQWFYSKLRGAGKATTPDGDVVRGVFVNGYCDAVGSGGASTCCDCELVKKNGDTAKGEFKAFRLTEFGNYHYKLHGTASYYYANGDIFKGRFAEGKRHGEGTFVPANGVRRLFHSEL